MKKHGHQAHVNHDQRHEGRMRDEGEHAKHMRSSDGGVPITGPMGRKIHGAHTGEMAGGHKTGMVTDSGKGKMIHGKPGDHQENK